MVHLEMALLELVAQAEAVPGTWLEQLRQVQLIQVEAAVLPVLVVL